jgi:TPR repeat protein
MPKTDEEIHQNMMERVKANDPVAIFQMGVTCFDEGDYVGAVEYFTKAAALGSAMAHFNLSVLYRKGQGVEKDMKKEIYHLEIATIGGHAGARFNLGYYEWNNGRPERAMKHWIIAAKLGYDDSLDEVKKGFVDGIVSKEEYAAALRGHQAAVDATKSEQREAAEKAIQEGRFR